MSVTPTRPWVPWQWHFLFVSQGLAKCPAECKALNTYLWTELMRVSFSEPQLRRLQSADNNISLRGFCGDQEHTGKVPLPEPANERSSVAGGPRSYQWKHSGLTGEKAMVQTGAWQPVRERMWLVGAMCRQLHSQSHSLGWHSDSHWQVVARNWGSEILSS